MTNGTSDYLQNLVKMSFFSGPFSEESSQWAEALTIFYWAWYISWAPFVGSFIARVSKGRTIREFVIGVIVAPTLFAIIWFSTFGGAALSLDIFSGIKISDVINTQGVEFAIFALLEQFPWSFATSLLAIILLFTYFVSSADSATYILGVQTSGGNLDPSNRLKATWGVMVAGTTTHLLWVGGINTLQTTLMIAALPVVILMILMSVSVYKSLREEDKVGQSGKTQSSQSKQHNICIRIVYNLKANRRDYNQFYSAVFFYDKIDN